MGIQTRRPFRSCTHRHRLRTRAQTVKSGEAHEKGKTERGNAVRVQCFVASFTVCVTFAFQRWLDQATQENLVPRAQSLALPVAEPERVSTALKKRLLKRFLTRSDDQDVLELAEQTSNAMAVAHAATASAPQPAASSRDGLPVSSELSQITAEAARHNSRQAFPAIEYEVPCCCFVERSTMHELFCLRA